MPATLSLPATRGFPNVYLVDAIGSAVLGLVLIAFAPALLALFDSGLPPLVLVVLGAMLLPWAVFNWWCARQPRLGRAAFGVQMAGDWGWITASLIMLIAEFPHLSAIGLAAAAGSALAVLAIVSLKLGTTNLS